MKLLDAFKANLQHKETYLSFKRDKSLSLRAVNKCQLALLLSIESYLFVYRLPDSIVILCF